MDNEIIVIEKFSQEKEFRLSLSSANSDYLKNIDKVPVPYNIVPIDFENSIYVINLLTPETDYSDGGFAFEYNNKRFDICNDDIYVICKIDFNNKKVIKLSQEELQDININLTFYSTNPSQFQNMEIDENNFMQVLKKQILCSKEGFKVYIPNK